MGALGSCAWCARCIWSLYPSWATLRCAWQVLRLTEEKRQLIEEAEAFEERMVEATKRAEKRRLSAANRAELEVW